MLQVDLNTQDSDLPVLLRASLGSEIIPADGARGTGERGSCPAVLVLPGWEYNNTGVVKERKSKLAFRCMSRDQVGIARLVSCPVLSSSISLTRLLGLPKDSEQSGPKLHQHCTTEGF